MLGGQMQAYQQAAAMHAAASQDAFAATMNQAQATQSAQLMQQAVLAGFPLSHVQATQMAQQAQQGNFMAHQALAHQQAAAAGAYFAQVRSGCRLLCCLAACTNVLMSGFSTLARCRTLAGTERAIDRSWPDVSEIWHAVIASGIHLAAARCPCGTPSVRWHCIRSSVGSL